MKMERKLSQILIKNKDHFAPKTYRQLSKRYIKLPHIYGLPKIHKDSIPLRLIVSCQSSVCHRLSRYHVDIIEPLIGKSPYVRNSSHFNNRHPLNMARETRTVYPGKRNKGLSSTFQPPEEGRSVQRPQRCDKHGDEDNSPKNVNDAHNTSSQIFTIYDI